MEDKNKIMIAFSLIELANLYKLIQKPNKLDDYTEPIRTARAKIAGVLYLDAEEIKNV